MKHLEFSTLVVVAALVTCTSLLTGCSSTTQGDGESLFSVSQLLGTNNEARVAPDTADNFDVFGEANPDRVRWSDLGPGRLGTTSSICTDCNASRISNETKNTERVTVSIINHY